MGDRQESVDRVTEIGTCKSSKGEHLNANNLVETFGFKELTYNLKYLESNNLISRENQNLDDAFGEYGLMHTGYDFLEKNGGLTREINEKLNTVFIKIDEEQFKALLIARIEKSELPKSQKRVGYCRDK